LKAAFYSIIPAMLLTACHSWSGDVGEPLQQVVKVESESPQRQRKNVVHDPVAAARQIDGYHAYLMAELLSEKGAYRQALVQLEYAYSLEENSFLATKLLALLLVLQDEVEIDKWADRLVLRHPESASLHFLYGNILLEKKLFALAIAEFNASLEDPSVNELAYIQLISAHEALGNSFLISICSEITASKRLIILAKPMPSSRSKRKLPCVMPWPLAWKINVARL
jgi:tetratricopeptide (TPR) repeat protein